MRWSVYLLAVIIASCTSFSRENVQQSKIDSLTNELKKRELAEKNQFDLKEVHRDSIMIEEIDDSEKESHLSDIKEIAAKKKEQKNNVVADQKDHEGKGYDSIGDNKISNQEPENYAAVDERNAVLKKVVTDSATFKPLLFGGFKDIKFNLSNHYPYRLDEVILKVHYIREDGSEIKTETKILKDIAPNARMELTAPDHERSGKKLKITVEAVQCRAIDLCFYRNEPAKSMDPYRCR